MRISDWSSDVCSSDLRQRLGTQRHESGKQRQRIAAHQIDRTEAARIVEEKPVSRRRFEQQMVMLARLATLGAPAPRHAEVEDHLIVAVGRNDDTFRSEEHTSELQSLMRISYDVFCLKKKTK